MPRKKPGDTGKEVRSKMGKIYKAGPKKTKAAPKKKRQTYVSSKRG